MKNIDRLLVKYHGRDVGILAISREKQVAFVYTKEWLQDGFSISPFSLPLKEGVFLPEKPYFGGLFGVFADSLPDAWGQLLVRRILRKEGMDPSEVDALGRLAMVGKSGMGALTYEPMVQLGNAPAVEDMDQLAMACRQVLLSETCEDIDTLYRLGGSSGGARPKITVRDGDRYWLVKFPAHTDMKEAGAMEYAYAKCAEKCGIYMPETKLLPSKMNSGYFAIERFDRQGDDRTHMLTAAALLEVDFQSPCLDYHTLMKLTKILTLNNGSELEQMYRRMCFNVYAHNLDDHAKNFTYLYLEDKDCFTLSPAYDLTYSTTYWGEHTTSVDGNGKDPSSKELIRVGREAGLSLNMCKRIDEEIHTLVQENLGEWIVSEW